MKKIELMKPVKEFEIGGEVFTVDTSSEAVNAWSKVWGEVSAEINAILADPEQEMTEEMLLTFYEEGLDATFGKGSYEKLYALCGKSLYVMDDLIKKLTVEFTNLKKV